jgi:DNA-binding IclR family transcriptional regulator
VLDFYVANYPATYTADEIARALNISEFSARPRLTELRALGWLIETTERRPNDSGCLATAMRASRQAMEAAHV